jgi:hypothetical protein
MAADNIAYPRFWPRPRAIATTESRIHGAALAMSLASRMRMLRWRCRGGCGYLALGGRCQGTLGGDGIWHRNDRRAAMSAAPSR